MQRLLLALICAVVLASCSTWQEKDGAPSASIDVNAIPNQVPKSVTRTRAGNAPSYKVFGKTYTILKDSKGFKERGYASWYGTKFHGKKTANGESYNMYAMTAAHKTLPIPSYVKVTRVSTGQSIIVRINDRGPFKKGRIIDLSYVAAKKLGVDKDGIALVEIEDITPDSSTRSPVKSTQANKIQAVQKHPPADIQEKNSRHIIAADWYLQLGAFQARNSAIRLQSKVIELIDAPAVVIAGTDDLHRVKIGPTVDVEKIKNWQTLLTDQGLSKGFIVRHTNEFFE